VNTSGKVDLSKIQTELDAGSTDSLKKALESYGFKKLA